MSILTPVGAGDSGATSLSKINNNFDAIENAGAYTAKNPPLDADSAVIGDSADSGKLKRVTWTNVKAFLKTYFDTIYNRATFGLATTDSPQFTAVNIGHATDTTLARVSAGVASIEGKNIALNGTSEALTIGTVELGHATDTTLARVSAGVIAVEGAKVPLVVGTPANDQIGVWTGDGTIEGDTGLTYTGGNLILADAKSLKSVNRNLIGFDEASDSTWAGAGSANAKNGAANIAIGLNVLANCTSGGENTMIGNGVGPNTTSGGKNTVVGRQAGGQISTGALNTSFGFQALNQVETGGSNVALGAYAGKYETGSGALYVDNRDRTNTAGDKAGALLYGTFNATPASQTLKINAGNTSTFGDVEVTDTTKGLILKSPDGTRWRVTVNNAGALGVASI
jgi:hypothetical protein